MTITPRRVAILSPVAWRTPPRQYGAWETVAGNIAEGLAAQHGGLLPNATLLRKNHGGLAKIMYTNRTAFAHIPQRKLNTNGREIANQPTA